MLFPHACEEHNVSPIMDDIACGLINIQNIIIKNKFNQACQFYL